MPADNRPQSKFFDIRRFPMDLGRVVCACLPLFFRLKRIRPSGERYTERLRGGAILAANHTSFADPFVVGVTFWYRRVFFLVAEVVMKNPIVATLLKGIGCIKVERNIADIEAIKKSVAILKSGRVLTIFPQGGISVEENVTDIKSGAALMALQAGVPIIPMYIHKRPHWYNRRRVVIGDTIYPEQICTKKIPSTKDIAAITACLSDEMNRCKEATP